MVIRKKRDTAELPENKKAPRGGALVYKLVLFSLNIGTNYIEVFKMATVPNRLDERPGHSKM
jgi:hypothetical protein